MAYVAVNFIVDKNIISVFETVKTKHGIRPEMSLKDLLMKSQLLLVNSDVHVQESPRPLLPNVIPVGGVTAKPARPLETVNQKWATSVNTRSFCIGFVYCILGFCTTLDIVIGPSLPLLLLFLAGHSSVGPYPRPLYRRW